MAKATGYNWWQYARYVYNVGRTSQYMAYTETEKEAIITFLNTILDSRPELKQRVNLKIGNSLKGMEDQNDLSVGKMLQIVGRALKLYSLTEEEKSACDALFEATANRKNKQVSIPQTEEVEETEEPTEQSEGSEEQTEEQGEEEVLDEPAEEGSEEQTEGSEEV